MIKILLFIRNLLLRIRFSLVYLKFRDYTMIPMDQFMENLFLAYRIRRIKGNVVECGVWRGGMIGGIAEVLGTDRSYFLFDSFEGLPPAKEIDGIAAEKWQSDKTSKVYFDNCTAEEGFAHKAMKINKDVDYKIKKGWFEDTLPNTDCGEIAVLRLDADWYDSTMICLEFFFDKVKKGGIILVDDYYAWEGCSKAIHKFLADRKSPEKIRSSKNGVCYILKS